MLLRVQLKCWRKMSINKINKSGQVTIFIILAVLIVIAIIIAFMLIGKFSAQTPEELNPKFFVEKCAKDIIENSAEKILNGGGRIEPSFFKMYENEKYNYLCYSQEYRRQCINQYPQLKEIIENEILADSRVDIDQCFENLREESEKKGFSFSSQNMIYNLELAPGSILININKNLEISKGENSNSFSNFDTKILSPLYELMNVAREIVNQESKYCNFEYNGFMLLYPQFGIQRIDYEENKIYIITDINSNQKFKFAVRSCALPPDL